MVWPPNSSFGGPFTARIDDLAIDPNNPTVAYSFQGDYSDPDLEPEETRSHFLEINLDFQSPDLGTVTPIALLDKEGLIYIPNAFSPNDDGVNDYFQVFPNCGVASIDQFQVFDRFGSLVYSLAVLDQFSDPTVYWSGKINNTVVGPGVYLWRMEITLIDGSSKSLAGEVTVIY